MWQDKNKTNFWRANNILRNLKRDLQIAGFDYNTEKVRGVNLGGWFVIEP